jgi:hypothetical protein
MCNRKTDISFVWIKGYTYDQFAARKAKQYLMHDITKYEQYLVIAFIKAKESPEEALKILNEADQLNGSFFSLSFTH